MRNTLIICLLPVGILFAPAGEIFDYYLQHGGLNRTKALSMTAASEKSRGFFPIVSTNHGISEIGIERTGSFGGGATYTFIARNDGTFHYRGDAGVLRTGAYSGTSPLRQFHELANFILDSGYMGFQDEYRYEVTDASTVFTSVTRDGKRKVIRNYANAGPTTLWAIEQLIDQLMAAAEWSPGSPGLPKAPEPALPSVTRYDGDPVLRTAYIDSFRQGYLAAWENKEKGPAFAPTSNADKARVFGYEDGRLEGRAALAKWFGTNSPPAPQTSSASPQRQ